ncbi:MAG TPA: hypothetical protein VNU64_02345 [Burkholderiales bacterium]|nr:hypothetical protein [Burkholderiales bacterium]
MLTARFCLHRLRGTSKSPAHIAEMVVTSIHIPPLSVFWRLVGDQVPRGVPMRPTARTCKGCAVYRGHF